MPDGKWKHIPHKVEYHARIFLYDVMQSEDGMAFMGRVLEWRKGIANTGDYLITGLVAPSPQDAFDSAWSTMNKMSGIDKYWDPRKKN